MTDPTAGLSTASATHDAVLRENLERAQASAAHDAAAPRLSQAFNGRWTRRHWAHASLFATMGALLAAIGDVEQLEMHCKAIDVPAGVAVHRVVVETPAMQRPR